MLKRFLARPKNEKREREIDRDRERQRERERERERDGERKTTLAPAHPDPDPNILKILVESELSSAQGPGCVKLFVSRSASAQTVLAVSRGSRIRTS